MTNFLKLQDLFRFHNQVLLLIIYHLPLVFLFPSYSCGADSAVYFVNQGLRFYQQGNYDIALLAFENAEKLAPNDFLITYSQACTYLAAGRTEEAMEKFRASAFAPDRNLVYDSLLSLGNIAVDRASSWLSEPPEKTASANRRRFLAELLVAEKEFFEAIDILPNRREAKENLEAIRQWKNTLGTLWKENDLKIRAESLTAREQLDRIEQSQQVIYRRTVAETKLANSPKQFQALYLLAKEQADLMPEIELFWEKFQAEYSSPVRPRVPSDDREGEAQFSLDKTGLQVEELSRHITNSVNRLKSYDGKPALQRQSTVLEVLDEIQNDWRDYPQLVRLAAGRQGRLVSEADKSDSEAGDILWKQKIVYRGVQLFLKDALQTLPMPQAPALGDDDYSPEGLLRQSQQMAITARADIERLFKAIFTDLENNDLDAAKPNLRLVRGLLHTILEPLDEIPQSPRLSGNTSSQNSTPDSDFFGDSEDSEDNDIEDNKKSGNSPNSQPSELPDERPKGQQQSLEELVNSFTESLVGDEQNSQNRAEPIGGSAKSESAVDSKQSLPRQPQVADDDSGYRANLTPAEAEILKAAQEQANVLIRAVKRRQQDAQDFRNQIRQLFEPAKEREPKDW